MIRKSAVTHMFRSLLSSFLSVGMYSASEHFPRRRRNPSISYWFHSPSPWHEVEYRRADELAESSSLRVYLAFRRHSQLVLSFKRKTNATLKR